MPALAKITRPPLAQAPATDVVKLPQQGQSPAVSVSWDSPFGQAVTSATEGNRSFFEFAMQEQRLTPQPQILTFDQTAKRLGKLTYPNKSVKLIEPKDKKNLGRFGAWWEQVVYSTASFAGTYAAIAGVGSLLTFGAVNFLGQSFTQWPLINATAKILATLVAGIVPSLFPKPQCFGQQDTFWQEFIGQFHLPSYILTRHFINAVSFPLFVYIFLFHPHINHCNLEEHSFTSLLDWVHNRHILIFPDRHLHFNSLHHSQFLPALAYACGGALLAAAISPLFVKAVDLGKGLLTYKKRRRERNTEIALLEKILALQHDRELIRSFYKNKAEEIGTLLDKHIVPALKNQMRKLRAQQGRMKKASDELEKTKENLMDLPEAIRKKMLEEIDAKIKIFRSKRQQLWEMSILPLKKDTTNAGAIKKQLAKFLGVKTALSALEQANEQLKAAGATIIETDSLIAETALMREEMARQLFEIVNGADLACQAAQEIAATEVLGVPARPA